MFKRFFFVFLAAAMMATFLMGACGSKGELYGEKFWVITSKVNVYERANALSNVIGTFKFQDEVLGRDKRPRFNTPKDWLEIKFGPDGYGFVERRNVGDEALLNELKTLMASVDGKQIQAIGTAGRKSRFRIAPGRDAMVIEFLKDPVNIEMFERVITLRKEKQKEKEEDKKDVWYKVRLEDGRVGYLYTGNISFTPPGDISRYTQNRKPVSWHVLRVKEDKDLGLSGKEYITSYVSQGFDVGADFNRVELYTYDLRSGEYATAFAKSGLKGILPLTVMDSENGGKIIQIRQLIKGKDDKLLVQEYSFPSPIKMIREYEEDTVPAPH